MQYPMQYPWPQGHRVAVSLTYDDSLPVHWQAVAPAFHERGLGATFYTPVRPGFLKDIEGWRKAAAMGHELGNHSLFHPCRKKFQGEKSWIDDAYDLSIYTERRLREELDLANAILTTVDGLTERTYGNTCHELFYGPEATKTSMEPLLGPRFTASRGQHTGLPVDPRQPRFHNLGCRGGDRKTFDQFKGEIEELLTTGGWLIYCIHGVGEGTHGHFMDAGEHLKLLDFLHEKKGEIWAAPVVSVAKVLGAKTPAGG